MRLYILAALACYLSCCNQLVAQYFDFGAITKADFERPSIDSNANAFVLREYGQTSFFVDDHDHRVKLQHDYHVVIKIVNTSGFDAANFTVPSLKRGDDARDYFDNLKAVTYNLEGNTVVKTALERNKLYRENYSERVELNKFTLPDIREGSIIEVSYRTVHVDFFNFKSWTFQSNIPKVESRYVAIIPASFNYNATLRGYYKLNAQNTSKISDNFVLDGVRLDCAKIEYIMRNIPAFVEEEYMTAPKNFLSAIYYELESIYYPRNGSRKTFSKTWKDVDTELLNEKSFGGQIKKEELFETIVPGILTGKESKYEQARQIYNYIKRQIKWNKYRGAYAEKGIEKALETRSGNVGDINLALIAALRAAGIETYPVILSTRQNGLPNDLYPVLSDFDYVIACAEIDGNRYTLDATDPLLPFGSLPLACLNEKGRIIFSRKSSDWFPLTSTEIAQVSFTLTGKVNAENQIEGKLTVDYRGNRALQRRHYIKSFNSTGEFFEKVDEQWTNASMHNGVITNLDSVDATLTESFDIVLSLTSNDDKTLFYSSPTLIDRITDNPFKLQERTYPVDMGFRSITQHTIHVELPDQYHLIDVPKNIAMALPESAARYRYSTTREGNTLDISQTVAFNKPVYSVEEYYALKEFYSRIIQQQKMDIQLSKP